MFVGSLNHYNNYTLFFNTLIWTSDPKGKRKCNITLVIIKMENQSILLPTNVTQNLILWIHFRYHSGNSTNEAYLQNKEENYKKVRGKYLHFALHFCAKTLLKIMCFQITEKFIFCWILPTLNSQHSCTVGYMHYSSKDVPCNPRLNTHGAHKIPVCITHAK